MTMPSMNHTTARYENNRLLRARPFKEWSVATHTDASQHLIRGLIQILKRPEVHFVTTGLGSVTEPVREPIRRYVE